jgi:hypothetical protein
MRTSTPCPPLAQSVTLAAPTQGPGGARVAGQAGVISNKEPAMSIPFETKIDLKNPIWNRDAWARIQADLNPEKETICHCRGEVLGVKPGEAVKQLCNFETFLATRLIPQEDGTIRRLNKEVIFYTDPRSNQIIHEWTNPWTGEVVPVVHVFNDPFNYTISEWLILAPEDFPKDGSKPEPRKIPLMFPWYPMGDDRLVLNTDMHLYYPNALQPDKWPRESGGKMAQVSEMMRYIVKREDLENPELTSVPMVGSWSRITPWLPWMLMGQTDGHCLYISTMTKSDNADIVPEHVRKFSESQRPGMLQAPTEDYGPSISSLEYFAKEQTPAAPLKD